MEQRDTFLEGEKLAVELADLYLSQNNLTPKQRAELQRTRGIHRKAVETLERQNAEKTKVINFFGGPGAGKTASCWYVASQLKAKGYSVEYVPEYAKELVWDGNVRLLNGSKISQQIILNEQQHRLDRLIGKVDYVLTDSPLMLNSIYLKSDDKEDYQNMLFDKFSQYNNHCVFIERGESFEVVGRIHNYEQSVQLDSDIKALLEEYHIDYQTYGHNDLDQIVEAIMQEGQVNHLQNSEVVEVEETNRFYDVRKNPYSDSPENSYILQEYIAQRSGRAKLGDILYMGTSKNCYGLMRQLRAGELTKEQIKAKFLKSAKDQEKQQGFQVRQEKRKKDRLEKKKAVPER